MTPDAATEAVKALFWETWQAQGLAAVPIHWPGVEFDPPADGSAWARFTMLHAAGGDAGHGGEMYDREGSVIVQCFAPIGGGQLEAQQMANAALAAFEGKQAESVWFHDTHPVDVGTDRLWYQTNAVATFRYNQQR